MTDIEDRRNELVSKLKNLDDTDPFEFVNSLEDTNDPAFVYEDGSDEDSIIYHMLHITITEDSYSVKYSVKDDDSIINIKQEFIEDPEDIVDYILNQVDQY